LLRIKNLLFDLHKNSRNPSKFWDSKNIIPKMTKLLFEYLTAFFFILSFISCQKEAGEGGSGKITGKLYGYDINNNGVVTDSGYAGGLRVYISFGEEGNANNDVRTSFNGQYEFTGLRKGNYTVFAYSQCDSCIFNQATIKQTVTLSNNRDEVNLPDLVIFD